MPLGMVPLLLGSPGNLGLCGEGPFPGGSFCRETLGIFTPDFLLWQLLWAESNW